MKPNMNIEILSAQFQANAKRIQALVEQVGEAQARWKPDPETWSLLEVLNHLYEEEMLDFRTRLEILLSASGAEWPPINPQVWVTERSYNTRDLAQSLQNFLDERQKSIEWLAQLENPNWQARAATPWGGEMSAGDMFAAWAAHDLLHIRQLVELHWAWLNQHSQGCQIAYAGDW